MVSSLTLQFRPDWPHCGRMVIESMAEDGRYRSQFMTGISNGGLSAFPGGDRWRWESRLFNGRYDSGPPEHRPVYGAWNRRDDPYGGAIRFGSAYAIVNDEVISRSTFCFPDSVFEPADFGDRTMLPHLCELADSSGFDDLDECIEAHVHGPVAFSRDIDAVVLDPSFAGTAVEVAASQLGCAVRFHPGFVVTTADLDTRYRGAEAVALARRLGDRLTPDVLGHAARSGLYDPQVVKKVWHLLARFGRVRA